MKKNFLTFFLMVVSTFCNLSGQNIHGTVIDESGDPLPYVSIYMKGTTTGTTSNSEGYYELKLDQGRHTVVFQFIGYSTVSKVVNIEGEDVEFDVVMKVQSTLLSEVIIAADREDPAYAIIRNAIRMRSYYRDLLTQYSCNVYVKGNQKILKAPEKILGFEIGDLDGLLDSSRQGIVYLSESVSQLHVSQNKYKEVVTSSKISGNDRGYSFNSAHEMEFSFYDNTIELQRQMISPIANNALAYYKYKLEGTFQDDDGRTINQIRVIPKRESDPSFYGTLYVVDGLWNIHSLELGATAASTQVYFVDSLTFSQIYVPIEHPDKWALFSNTISFKLGAFGFELKGLFTGVYSNYSLEPEFPDDFFDANVHVVEPESNERDSIYWAEIRPVPLSVEEKVDYFRKDSIHKVRTDPIYMDSVDRKSNNFKPGNLLGGYNYTRRSKRFYYSFSSPLGAIQFNTVQGYNLGLSFDARKYYDEAETRRLLFGAHMNYGFSEERLRINGYITYRPSRIDLHRITIRGGSSIEQFNDQNPISPFLNSVYSLLNRRNYAKYLDLKKVELSYLTEPTAGIFLNSSVRWENRTPLINNSDLSYFKKDEVVYLSNDPLRPDSFEPSFEEHQALILAINGTVRFKQKYFLYPDRKFFAGNEGPTFRFNYTGAYRVGGSDVGYQKIAMSLEDEWSFGVGGRFHWYVNGGFFFDKKRIEFRDYRHYTTSQIFLMNPSDYLKTFLQLPYYQFSAQDRYFQLHLQHYFDGYILDKVPLFQKLGWSFVAGYKVLKSDDFPLYQEIHLGLNNMGYRIVRLLRMDVVLSFQDGQRDWGVRLGLALN